MATGEFSSAEWKQLISAPQLILHLLSLADRATFFPKRSEAKTLEKFLESYHSQSSKAMREAQALKQKAEAAKQEAEAAKQAVEEAKKEAENIYVVKSGDTLSGIAQKVYGKAGRWPEIFEANKDIIENPNLIRPGWKLRIP